MEKKKMLLICSGGLDSVAWGLMKSRTDDVSLMVFDYGQKAAQKEMDVVAMFSLRHQLGMMKIDISGHNHIFGNTQLTSHDIEIEIAFAPSVIVPLRNALFLQFAMCFAYSHDYDAIGLGFHADDSVNNKFPDSSRRFLDFFETTMRHGVPKGAKYVSTSTPAQAGLRKKDILRSAADIDREMLWLSWSCYTGGKRQCGVCVACRNRKAAFQDAGVEDKTEYEG